MRAPRIEPPIPLEAAYPWSKEAEGEIFAALNALLADLFTLHLKTKNFHWHASGPQFSIHQLMFSEQASQIFRALDIIAERVRALGGDTIRSVEHILRLARLRGNDADAVSPRDMLDELRLDNRKLVGFLRDAHLICVDYVDIGTASALAALITEAEKRIWALTECMRSI
jgi:starvation-inducible DNA-binding protein